MRKFIAPLLVAASIPSISSADDFNQSAEKLTIPNDPYFECIERALDATFNDTYNAESSNTVFTTNNGPLYVFEHGTVNTPDTPDNIISEWAQVTVTPDGNVSSISVTANEDKRREDIAFELNARTNACRLGF